MFMQKRFIFGCLFLSAILFNKAYAQLLESVDFKEGQKVGVFIGSFDPLHDGHLRVINTSFLDENCEYVLVLPDHLPASSKPNRTSFDLRKQMLKRAFTQQEKILITEKNYEEALQFLKERKVKLVGIIGSDTALHPNRLSAYLPEYWLVFTRQADAENQDYKNISMIKERPVIKINLENDINSSTQVKADYKKGIDLWKLPIPEEIKEYVSENGLYSD